MAAIARLFCILLLVAISLPGCRNSDELNAYLRYRECAGSDCFKRLAPQDRTAVFFGAMEIHPPDVSFHEQLAKEDLAYLKALQAVIARRGGSYEAYAFVSAIKLKEQRGELSGQQVKDLQLASFCKARGDLYNLCSTLLQ